ncbi:hypothetical protein [Rhodococcus wratislaviensis]|uniref:Transposase n=1 Tax=Rhodococcus wratislaviensis NBRC 100605 TaxID=1219028 RepID=X0PKX0_RHOWR|nr:hypothetical protein [Rhodococcus wratislaviensis]GAF42958.1 hypothetical protein RW1_005_00630 [Rhodococcus wratislaviensis NBRC 100605]
MGRTAPMLSMRIGSLGQRKPRHRLQEFLLFLKHLVRAYSERQLYPVKDNDATRPKSVSGWRKSSYSCISRPPRIMDEPCGGVVQTIRTAGHPPRTFSSVNELTTKIRTFINGCNTRCAPFVWTNTADQVLTEGKP